VGKDYKLRNNNKLKMKKAIIPLFFALLLAGCGVQGGTKTEAYKNNQAGKPLPAQEQKIMSNEEAKQDLNKPNPNLFEDLGKDYQGAIIKTDLGDIKVEFYNAESPFTVNNFLNLAKIGFYDKTVFHRVIKDFMIQGGDPNSKDDDFSDDGRGGPGYRFGDEFNSHPLVRGSLAMANSGANTNGSQFFIVTAEATSWLDGKHTNFGKVVSGMETVDKIEALSVDDNDHPALGKAIIKGIELIKK
jgi:cyclophilin family peptidyl-prolyl cis-trans isomerase